MTKSTVLTPNRFRFMAVVGLSVTMIAEGRESPTCALANRQIESCIKRVASRLKGIEYCEFRSYARGDVDGDHQDDLVVLFHVEGPGGGGNNNLSFLALFGSRIPKTPAIQQIGERGKRTPVEVTIAGTRIAVSFDVWNANDAMCCPSEDAESEFALEGNRLTEAAKARAPSER